MNITKEDTGDLTATIKVEVAPEDYNDKVTNALKELQRKTSMKGFRPGKVPFGMVSKMYRKSAMAEEVNKLLSESLNNYLLDNKIEILGYPMPGLDRENKADFDNDEAFEFYFDIGIAPEINLTLDDKIEVDYNEIEVEDSKVDGYMKEVRQRYGSPVNPEKADKGDLLRGDIVQVGKDGQPLEGGVTNTTSISIDFIKDEKVQKQFIGCKVGDKIVFNPLKATENESETASLLSIKRDEREQLEADYEFTVTEISRIEPAEVNKEFFARVYPADNIETEEAFREKLRGEAREYFQKESDNFFTHEVIEKLVHDTEVKLPDDFLKRWLIDSENEITGETIEHDYVNYVNAMKQQLIINKIARDHDVKVDRQNIKDHIKQMYGRQFMIDLQDEEKSKQLDTLAESVMRNEEEVKKIYDQLFDEKMRELFKTTLKLKKTKINYDDFIEKVNEHHHKHHHHEHE